MSITSDLVLSSFDTFLFSDHLSSAVKESGIDFMVIANLIYHKFGLDVDSSDKTKAIRCLPSHYESPLIWSREDVNFLFRQYGLDEHISMKLPFNEGYKVYEARLRTFDGIDELCPQCLTVDAWVWGYFACQSRVFAHTLATDKQLRQQAVTAEDRKIQGYAMYLVIDLTNHMHRRMNSSADSAQPSNLSVRDGRLTFSTDRGIKVGQQVVWEYQKLSNIDLLYGHGFVLPGNPYDYTVLTTKKWPNFECPERTTQGKCQFKLTQQEVNPYLTWYIRARLAGTKEVPLLLTATEAIYYYRSIYTQSESGLDFSIAHFKYRIGVKHAIQASLRTTRQQIHTAESYQRSQVYQLKAEQVRSAYIALQRIDERLLQMLLIDIGI